MSDTCPSCNGAGYLTTGVGGCPPYPDCPACHGTGAVGRKVVPFGHGGAVTTQDLRMLGEGMNEVARSMVRAAAAVIETEAEAMEAKRVEQEQRLGKVAQAAYELGEHAVPWNEVGLATKHAYIKTVGALLGPRP